MEDLSVATELFFSRMYHQNCPMNSCCRILDKFKTKTRDKTMFLQKRLKFSLSHVYVSKV